MKPIRIYRCPDTICGILTGIYDAGTSRYGHDYIRLETTCPDGFSEMQLFCEYIEIAPDSKKADIVADSVKDKISSAVYMNILHLLLSSDTEKANIAYHFLVYGFHIGERIIHALQIPWVKQVFEINRAVENEAHFFREFLRFSNKDNIYISVIEPKNHIVSLIMPHFADRLNTESFIIYDKTHMEAGMHPASNEWYIRNLLPDEGRTLEKMYNNNDTTASLWKTFFDAIAIKERTNPSLQRNMCPIHFRKYMTEFKKTPN